MRTYCKLVALIAMLLVAAAGATAQIVDMNVQIPTVLSGTSDGTIDLTVTLDAVVIDAPDAYVRVQLWGRDSAGDWERLSPVEARTTVAGDVLPGSPETWHEFKGQWAWLAPGHVERITYDRTGATALYIAGRRAATQ